MIEEYREFDMPVLLVPPDDSATSASDSPAEKYRYLLTVPYIYMPPRLTFISELKRVVLDAVREDAHQLKIRPDSEMKVSIYEVRQMWLA